MDDTELSGLSSDDSSSDSGPEPSIDIQSEPELLPEPEPELPPETPLEPELEFELPPEIPLEPEPEPELPPEILLEPEPEPELPPESPLEPEPEPELPPEIPFEPEPEPELPPESPLEPEPEPELPPEIPFEPEPEPDLPPEISPAPEQEPELQLETLLEPEPEPDLPPEIPLEPEQKPEFPPEISDESEPEPELSPETPLEPEPEPELPPEIPDETNLGPELSPETLPEPVPESDLLPEIPIESEPKLETDFPPETVLQPEDPNSLLLTLDPEPELLPEDPIRIEQETQKDLPSGRFPESVVEPAPDGLLGAFIEPTPDDLPEAFIEPVSDGLPESIALAETNKLEDALNASGNNTTISHPESASPDENSSLEQDETDANLSTVEIEKKLELEEEKVEPLGDLVEKLKELAAAEQVIGNFLPVSEKTGLSEEGEPELSTYPLPEAAVGATLAQSTAVGTEPTASMVDVLPSQTSPIRLDTNYLGTDLAGAAKQISAENEVINDTDSILQKQIENTGRNRAEFRNETAQYNLTPEEYGDYLKQRLIDPEGTPELQSANPTDTSSTNVPATEEPRTGSPKDLTSPMSDVFLPAMPADTTTLTDGQDRDITVRRFGDNDLIQLRAYDTAIGSVPETTNLGTAGMTNLHVETAPDGSTQVKLQDIVIPPDYRDAGITGNMLDQTVEIAKAKGASAIYGVIENEDALGYWKHMEEKGTGWKVDPNQGAYGYARYAISDNQNINVAKSSTNPNQVSLTKEQEIFLEEIQRGRHEDTLEQDAKKDAQLLDEQMKKDDLSGGPKLPKEHKVPATIIEEIDTINNKRYATEVAKSEYPNKGIDLPDHLLKGVVGDGASYTYLQNKLIAEIHQDAEISGKPVDTTKVSEIVSKRIIRHPQDLKTTGGGPIKPDYALENSELVIDTLVDLKAYFTKDDAENNKYQTELTFVQREKIEEMVDKYSNADLPNLKQIIILAPNELANRPGIKEQIENMSRRGITVRLEGVSDESTTLRQMSDLRQKLPFSEQNEISNDVIKKFDEISDLPFNERKPAFGALLEILPPNMSENIRFRGG